MIYYVQNIEIHSEFHLLELRGTITMAECILLQFARKDHISFSWQTRFHDRIIRNQDELNRIAQYVENNPAQWELDEFNKEINP